MANGSRPGICCHCGAAETVSPYGDPAAWYCKPCFQWWDVQDLLRQLSGVLAHSSCLAALLLRDDCVGHVIASFLAD